MIGPSCLMVSIHRCPTVGTVFQHQFRTRLQLTPLSSAPYPQVIQSIWRKQHLSARAAADAVATPLNPAPHINQLDSSWRLETSAPFTVAIVDGHNLAFKCTSRNPPPFQPSFAHQFSAWLRFLKAYCRAAVMYVAFDNKGSSSTNYRAAIEPAYLRKRYKKKAAAGALFDIASLSALPGGPG